MTDVTVQVDEDELAELAAELGTSTPEATIKAAVRRGFDDVRRKKAIRDELSPDARDQYAALNNLPN